jgi:hypothetical protein
MSFVNPVGCKILGLYLGHYKAFKLNEKDLIRKNYLLQGNYAKGYLNRIPGEVC